MSFIDPYGMVGLLEICRVFEPDVNRKVLYIPESEEVLKYLERMGFFRFANAYFKVEPFYPQLSEKYLRSPDSDALLEITRIEKSDDIHFIVGKVKDRANAILTRHLQYDERAINGFIVSLSGRFSLKSDLHSIEKALLHGASRYEDEGRGHGKKRESHLTPFPGAQINILLPEI